ncbi:hypothetical protein ANABIO32_27790 [Rossellomorea marisflavi]|uniref:hypothetical protein n=1 Tax=Rossellomorea marisflavi TaxID=189381 RepID=UPI0025C9AFE7|nr:hypothetical protein [Rossellomorea marisflavi]GLI85059.1 hypothetical protein ANABIO32_27790 [Rossellomorea marisflavi]
MSEGNENIRFPSYEHVSMKPDEQEDVYERLVESMEKKGRKKQRLVPTLLTALLAALFILAGGYLLLNTVMTDQTASQEGEVKEVLERIFTGPDDELASLMEQEDRYIEEGTSEEYFDLFLSYYKDLFRPYMSPDTIEQYVNEGKITFPYYAYSSGYKLKAEKIVVKENETVQGSFTFTVKVVYSRDGDVRGTVDLSGDITVNDQGLVESIRFRDKGVGELMEKVR